MSSLDNHDPDVFVPCDTRTHDKLHCPARSLVHVELSAGGELHYCGHHGDEYLPKLRPLAARVIDDRLLGKTVATIPSASASAFV